MMNGFEESDGGDDAMDGFVTTCVTHAVPKGVARESNPISTPQRTVSADNDDDIADENGGGVRLISCDNIKYEICENDDHITVHTFVKDCTSSDIFFGDDSLEVKFTTSDPKFNSAYNITDGESVVYIWKVTLRDTITPNECSHKRSKMKIEIKLKKRCNKFRWNSLTPTPSATATSKSEQTVTASSTSTADNDEQQSNFVFGITKEKLDRWNSLGTNGWKPCRTSQEDSDANKCTQTVSQESSDAASGNISSNGGELVVANNSTKINNINNTYCNKRAGFTGLDNLGNTCFMNSVIQCLSNTDPFRDYFLSGHYQQDINKNNPLGTGGVIANAFANLLHQLWSGKQSSVQPQRLKAIISEKVSQQFSGFAQHDAQELMAFLLDALHEDLNRVQEKPYTCVNTDNGNSVPDEVLADDAWKRYRMRNDSIVVDLFQGQYKSKLTCPVCGKISITFDPILYLSVPFPPPPITHEVYYFARDATTGMSRKRPVKYTVKLPHDALVKHLFEYMSQYTGVHWKKFRLILGTSHLITKFLQPMWVLAETRFDQYLLLFEIFNSGVDNAIPNAIEDRVEFAVVQRLCLPPKPENCGYCEKNIGWDNVELERCENCLRVGYCNKTCEKEDMISHKRGCVYSPEPVGQPFVISLPKSQLTYRNLCAMAFSYARHSLTFPRRCFTDDNLLGGRNFTLNLNEFQLPPPFTLHVHRDIHTDFDLNSDILSTLKQQYCEQMDDESDVNCDKIYDTPLTALNLDNHYILTMVWNNRCEYEDDGIGVGEPIEVEDKHLVHTSDIKSDLMTRGTDSVMLADCLRLFTEPEVLTPQEAWYCPQCKEHREATKQISLWRLPSFLVVQLKRFSFRNNIWRDKIDRLVTYPIDGLDISEFYCRTEYDPEFRPIYDLYAVVNHYGGMFGGHYTAIANSSLNKESLGWRLFDDSRVEEISEDYVVNRNAYMLFYKLRE